MWPELRNLVSARACGFFSRKPSVRVQIPVSAQLYFFYFWQSLNIPLDYRIITLVDLALNFERL